MKFYKKFAQIFLLATAIASLNVEAVISGGSAQVGSQVVGTSKEKTSNDITTKPQLISSSCGEPIYPSWSRRNNEEGTVGVQLFVNEKGEVVTGKVASSSGFPMLDEGAIIFLSHCRFEPATKNGVPIAVWLPLKQRWKIADNHAEESSSSGMSYQFEDPTRSAGFLTYVHESCVSYVARFNIGESGSGDAVGVRKVDEKSVCGCVEQNVRNDRYLNILVTESVSDLERMVDNEKMRIYSSRKTTSNIMQCMSQDLDSSIDQLDPRKK